MNEEGCVFLFFFFMYQNALDTGTQKLHVRIHKAFYQKQQNPSWVMQWLVTSKSCVCQA